ncbi:protein cereblon isoform X1 [Octopus bimaculoides]|uniref:Protein cereblon n=1 Tax=Octopus bimaculoides TaxID=37653 RepID=A0A0L8HQR6_OCTBM|nr:protein cereblon isoform X1 [Octopus bimaculoides]|eukprot:XP_014770293.1 PREDICTED: protein cereblon-like isoform X1 [Octopus bimaculoides]
MADELLPLLGHHLDAVDSESEDEDEESIDVDTDNDEDEQQQQQQQQAASGRSRSSARPLFNTTFDKSLPVAHSYLGEDLEEVRGRTIHDDEACISLPIITLPSVILVPGQTIPLHLFQSHTVAMMKNLLDKDKTFGVITTSYSPDDDSSSMASIGTTAEIYSIKDETDNQSGIATVKMKARGRQRFRVIEFHRQTHGILMAKVHILPEKIQSDYLDGARPQSHYKFCCCPTQQDLVVKTAVDRNGEILRKVNMLTNKQLDKFTSSYFTQWPPWVYKMYDTENLIQRIRKELCSWNESLKTEVSGMDPVDFSYWVLQNLPLDDSRRIHLLSIDSAVQRLRCELSIMQNCSILCCRKCDLEVANKSDVFSMSLEGPLAAYVNPGGHVHETVTVHKAKGLTLIGQPSTENSWFPGYAWTIINCSQCGSHMGWRFTAAKRKLSPQKFWGLCRASLIPGINDTDVLVL